jgi:hypothetical protein
MLAAESKCRLIKRGWTAHAEQRALGFIHLYEGFKEVKHVSLYFCV